MQHIIGSQPYDEELDEILSDADLEKQVRVDIARGAARGEWSCTWLPDGSVACGPRNPRMGPREPTWDEVMAMRQSVAGEEDQSAPGWDQGV